MRSALDLDWCSSGRWLGPLAAALVLAAAAPATAEVYLSQQEAIALAFPAADRVERTNLILTAGQVRKIRELARAPVKSKIVRVYQGFRGDQLQGHAFIDVHRVRTLSEALMIVLDPAGSVRSVRLLAFHEPREYAPHERWLAQFRGKSLAQELRLRRDVQGISGSTLSSRAVTRSIRLALAYHQVLLGGAAPRPAPNPIESAAEPAKE